MSRGHATDRLSGLDDVVRNCEGEAGVVLRRRVRRRAVDSDEGSTWRDVPGGAPLLNSYIPDAFRCGRKPAHGGALEDLDVEHEAKRRA